MKRHGFVPAAARGIAAGVLFFVCQALGAEDLPSGLLGWWRFEEAAGESVLVNVADPEWPAHVGDKNHDAPPPGAGTENLPAGDLVNGTVADVRSMRVSGDNTSVWADDAGRQPAAFTFECFFMLEHVSASGWRTVATKMHTQRSTGTGWRTWSIWVQDGLLRCRFDDGNGTKYWVTPEGSGVPVAHHRWYHVALTYSGGTARLYLDGALVWEAGSIPLVYGSGAVIGTEPYGFGCMPRGVGKDGTSPEAARSQLYGYIDEVRLFDRVLQPSEFLHASWACPSGANVAAWFRMGDGNSDGRVLENRAGFGAPNAYSDLQVIYPDRRFFHADETPSGAVWTKEFGGEEVSDSGSLLFNGKRGDDPRYPETGTTNCWAMFGLDRGTFTNSYTVEILHRPRGVQMPTRMLFMCAEKGGTNWTVKIQYAENGRLQFAVGTESRHAVLQSREDLWNNQEWRRAAFVYDKESAELRLYVDGVLEARTAAPTPFSISASNEYSCFIGGGHSAGNDARHPGDEIDNSCFSFRGLMSEVRVTRSALHCVETLATAPCPRYEFLPDKDRLEVLYDFENTCWGRSSPGLDSTAPLRLTPMGGFFLTNEVPFNKPFVFDGRHAVRPLHTNAWSAALGYGETYGGRGMFYGGGYNLRNYTLELFLKWRNEGQGGEFGPLLRKSKVAATNSVEKSLAVLNIKFNGTTSCLVLTTYNSGCVQETVMTTSKTLSPDGNWHHLAYTVRQDPDATEKTVVTLYYDYEQIGQLKLGYLMNDYNSAGGFVFGNAWRGLVDNLRVTDAVLAPDEFLRAGGKRGVAIFFR